MPHSRKPSIAVPLLTIICIGVILMAGFRFGGEAGAGSMVLANLLFALAAALLAGLAMAAWFTRSVSRPMAVLTDNLRRLAAGDTGFDIAGETRNDRIGDLARSVAACRDAAIETDRAQHHAEETRAQTARELEQQETEEAAEHRRRRVAGDELAAGLRRLAEGDFSCRIETVFPPVVESLRADFNALVDQFNQTLSEVSANVVTINGDTTALRAATDDLSSRTSAQAASLEQAAAALEEITATVKNTSERADEARNRASEAKLSTDRSGQVVTEAIDAMVRIEDASGEISKIINVIDEISFQTNLLALNAGVEAARAGDAGRGFAVVAHEVRELARRAAGSAKEIKVLIRKSSEEVKSGVSLVRQAGDALGQIAGDVGDINHQIKAIAIAAHEQASGLTEVNSAFNQMDYMTQQNAAMVEQTTRVTLRLSSGATSLDELVHRFMQPGAGKTSRLAQEVRDKGHGPVNLAAAPGAGQSASKLRPGPAESPARHLVRTVGRAYGAGNAAQTQMQDDWEEF
ncbi:methyl-accepting chemotaxis protein [Hoeflea ulvae]|uniref:Methyl-accepting chemotaxis protein n=1 Tax=Hoeflea ulvae TaxID=2983764 RepID=A0ABT3YBF8_9HYPH|nr:methyl-accepting chemotaxis protein [Hoeflea ulvae]MCY0093220.1 methyl-accepting chemotaxis protein [Hoeflea ulvae]